MKASISPSHWRTGSWLALSACLVGLVGAGLSSCAANPDSCSEDAECMTGFMCVANTCREAPREECVDEDGDGFFTGPCPANRMIDCNDDDATINPGQPDLCGASMMGDNIDQNCMDGADETCACPDGMTEVACSGSGACAGATRDCVGGVWGPCLMPDGSPMPSPEPEDCDDAIDNDCNGVVNNGCLVCGSRPDGAGTEMPCPDSGMGVFCSSNGTCR
ncbi:MAG: MopE-related protein [Sandaracinaceae bacterium]